MTDKKQCVVCGKMFQMYTHSYCLPEICSSKCNSRFNYELIHPPKEELIKFNEELIRMCDNRIKEAEKEIVNSRESIDFYTKEIENLRNWSD